MSYNKPAPLKLKCLAVSLMTRAEDFEMVDGVVEAKSKKMVAKCGLSDGQQIIVAHLQNENCVKIEEGCTYIIKNSNVTDKYGQKSLFFNANTVVFKTANIEIPAAIKENCHHIIHPTSGPLDSSGDYFTVTGVIISLNSIRMIVTKDGPIPARDLVIDMDQKQHEVTLWREAALTELALSQLIEITHLKKSRKLNSSVHTTLKKPEKKSRHGIEVIGVSAGQNSTLLLTNSMDELIIPHKVWNGQIDELVTRLPIIINVLYEEGEICSVDNLDFVEV